MKNKLNEFDQSKLHELANEITTKCVEYNRKTVNKILSKFTSITIGDLLNLVISAHANETNIILKSLVLMCENNEFEASEEKLKDIYIKLLDMQPSISNEEKTQ